MIMIMPKSIPVIGFLRFCPHASSISPGGRRAFALTRTRPLQRLFDWRTKREKQADEACEKTREAAESLKEGAKQIKDTTEFVRDVVLSTSKTVTGMAKEVKEKITDTADEIKEKLKEPIHGIAKEVVNKVEDAAVEKIRDRVMGGGGKPTK